MSKYPSTPSYGGPFDYAQQWPPSASMPPILPHNFTFPPDYSASLGHQSRGNAGNPLDYNDMGSFHANSRIPGLGGPGPLPPPPFPFMNQFNPSQLPPPPFPPVQMAPVRYPPMPLPVAPNQTEQHRSVAGAFASHTNNGARSASDSQPTSTATSGHDDEREEGELSDGEEQPSARKDDTVTETRLNPKYENSSGAYAPGTSIEQSDSGMRGASRSSSRDSGSPYNPPVSVTVEPHVIHETLDSQVRNPSKPLSDGQYLKSSSPSIPTEAQSSNNPGKPHAQLRVQAQGALLSLAPHNIRYSELVREGINPVVLRQLYEEVGIKVSTPPSSIESGIDDTPSKPAISVSPVERSRETSDQPLAGQMSSVTGQADHSQSAQTMEADASDLMNAEKSKLAEKVVAPLPYSTSQAEANKPLERKEVIARMLAAKAAKATGTSQSVKAVEKDVTATGTSAATDTSKPATTTPLVETTINEKEAPTREKNKAQTELARQRIEQLKRQGLMRSQRSQPHAVISNTVQEGGAVSQIETPSNSHLGTTVSAIQHPLPDRPPQPESTLPARIPGLFMTGSEETSSKESTAVPEQFSAVDTAPQPRVTHRKRPRASDFDEPTITSKKPFGAGIEGNLGERLVIDISDDELLYGDDEADEMEIESSPDETPQGVVPHGQSGSRVSPLQKNLARKPGGPLGMRPSTSSTPNTPLRGSDQEDLRRKDLEIQAMRRRIAEMEQRRKAKLASRTQSPRPSNPSASSSAEESSAVDAVLSELPITSSTAPLDNSQSGSVNVDSAAVDASLGELKVSNPIIQKSTLVEAAQLETLRRKLQRKQEIESGLPDLDAELRKSEARLAEFRHEEENLLKEIAKGREGRQRLLAELESLRTEVSGISLEELETVGRDREVKEQTQTSLNGTPELLPPSSSGDQNVTVSDAPAPKIDSLEETPPAIPGLSGEAEPVHEAKPPETAADIEPIMSGADGTDGVVDSGKDLSSSSLSESSGSAMDESSDSVRSASVDRLILEKTTTSTIQISEAPVRSETADLHDPSLQRPELQHTLPERPRFTDTDIPGDSPPGNVSQLDNVETQSSRESSVASEASEAYEPPEPELSADDADAAYTPPFSPAPPGPVEPMELTSPSFDQSRTKEPLTAEVQEPDSDAGNQPRIGLLDHEPQPEKSTFSPYVSPLRYFNAYRYHPNFLENVSGGYRSLTYSHNIDPMKCLCPFEATGGVCNDRSCEFQHFRDMTLSDDKILVQMGSLREGKTPEEKDAYIAGLKQIINDMRRDKVKDFETVATEIAAYRRRFLQDPSRILPL